MLTFTKRTPFVSKAISTLAAFIVANKVVKIELTARNFASDNRVVLFLTDKKGNELMITCSQPISNGLREKSISFAQLAAMEVAEQENSKGESYPALQRPASQSERFDITKVLKDSKAEYEPEKTDIDWEEYIGV